MDKKLKNSLKNLWIQVVIEIGAQVNNKNVRAYTISMSSSIR